MKINRLIGCAIVHLLCFISSAQLALAQNVAPSAPTSLRDALTLEATASAEVLPDLAVVTLAAEAQGADAAAVTREVQLAINAALVQAKTASGVEARTGAFATNQRYGNKGARDGWTVRAELILKGKEFAVLGTLAGKLAQQKLMIVSSGFELSRELREKEEQALIEQGIKAFRNKAQIASRAFGFANYSLREVNLGSINGAPQTLEPKAYAMRSAAAPAQDAETMAIVGGKITLSLSVSGTVTMSQ